MNAEPTKKATADPPKDDWSRFDAMTAAERHAAAVRDPDARPFTPEDYDPHAAHTSGAGDPAGAAPVAGGIRGAVSHSPWNPARLGTMPQRPRRRRPRLSGGDRAQPGGGDGSAGLKNPVRRHRNAGDVARDAERLDSIKSRRRLRMDFVRTSWIRHRSALRTRSI